MRRYARQAPEARPFVITTYRPSSSGRVRPDLPTTCPLAHEGEGDCAIGIHHWRVRRCGPGFPLAVARCRRHRRAFTLYVPGWVPYGRQPVAPAKLDGGRGAGWEGTLFELALETSQGERWSWEIELRDKDGLFTGMCRLGYTTEYAHLDACTRLLGVHGHQEVELRHSIGEMLVVPTQILLGLASRDDRPRYLARARVVTEVLDRLPSPADWQALLVAGHLAGLWGEPLWCRDGHLVPLAFRGSGTPQSKARRRYVQRSTTSVTDRARPPP